MLDIKLIRENPKLVQKSVKDKGIEINIDQVIGIDKKHSNLSISVQKLREERNKLAKEKNIEKGKELKLELEGKEKELGELKLNLNKLLLEIPNSAKGDVKVGIDESKNEIIKKYKTPTKFDFKILDHLELGEALEIIDIKSAAKVSGTRFAYLKNEGALLEFALIQYAMEFLTNEKFIPIIPPVLINRKITEGLGYWNGGGNEEYYYLNDPDEKKEMYLIGTAEHSIVPMYMDDVLNKKEMPLRYVAFSSAFRREAGSYGKDTKGILRVHQFDKVEMVSFTIEENDDKEHDYLLSLQEKLFQSLEIPYQVVKMCTGDLGFPAARKYDLEAWMPGQGKYREVTSVSTTTDFQSRRLNIKYQDGNEKKYVHILNGTAFAIGRTIIAILENNQNEDGSINIPKVLHKYLNFSKIDLKNKFSKKE